jgi:hypothetical protein
MFLTLLENDCPLDIHKSGKITPFLKLSPIYKHIGTQAAYQSANALRPALSYDGLTVTISAKLPQKSTKTGK